MRISNKKIKDSIRDSIESSTPDILPDILESIKSIEEGRIVPDPNIEELDDFQEKTMETRKTVFPYRWALNIAGIFIIFALAFFTKSYYTTETIIDFDVNPSIELKVNKSEKIIDTIALNPEGEEVLGDMKLKRVDLDVAVNAIIGSMVKNGYIDNIKNSILISVDSVNIDKERELQDRLLKEVGNILGENGVEGAVLAQIIKENDQLIKLADAYNITLGKATLIDLLIQRNNDFKFEDLAKLSINDINLLIGAEDNNLVGINSKGNASSKKYIGEEAAKSVGLKYLQLEPSSIEKSSIKVDYKNGRMVYKLKLEAVSGKHEFEIDAISGNIINHKGEIYKPKEEEEIILQQEKKKEKEEKTKEKIKEKVKEEKIKEEKVKEEKVKKEKQKEPKKEKEKKKEKIIDKSQENTNYIGANAAKNIALNHAGVSDSSIKKLEIELDKEDGIMVYEVEFEQGDLEYEYEINAITGAIVKWEIDD